MAIWAEIKKALNTNLDKPLNSLITDYGNVTNAIKTDTYNIKNDTNILVTEGNRVNSVSVFKNGAIFKSPLKILEINSPCEIISFYFIIYNNSNNTKTFKMVIDDDIYYLYTGYSNSAEIVISKDVIGDSEIFLVYYVTNGQLYKKLISGTNAVPLKLVKNTDNNISNGKTSYIIGTIKAYKNFSIEVFQVSADGVACSYSILART